jgi:hypothetical protein
MADKPHAFAFGLGLQKLVHDELEHAAIVRVGGVAMSQISKAFGH